MSEKSNRVVLTMSVWWVILFLVIMLGATILGAYWGIVGRNTQMVTIHDDDGDHQEALYRQVAFIPNTVNENWREAIVPSAALGGGYSYTVTAEQGDMTDADFTKALKSAAKVLKTRAELVTGDASVKVEDKQIVLTVPEKAYNSAVAMLLSPVGEYTLTFPNEDNSGLGEAVMDARDVKQSYYYANNGKYSIQMQLTKKGLSRFNALLADHAGKALYLAQDGQPVAAATMSASLLSDGVMTISTSDWTTAFTAVACLRSGAMSTAMTVQIMVMAGLDPAADHCRSRCDAGQSAQYDHPGCRRRAAAVLRMDACAQSPDRPAGSVDAGCPGGAVLPADRADRRIRQLEDERAFHDRAAAVRGFLRVWSAAGAGPHGFRHG